MGKPKILLVDDESTEREQRLLAESLKPFAVVGLRGPEQLTKDDLLDAELVLLDFNLGKWTQLTDEVPIARRPVNGLALAAVLRSHLVDEHSKSPHATAFALRSGFLAELIGDAAGSRGTHLIARLNNLDWVFHKGKKGEGSEEQILSLARAVGTLRKGWKRKGDTYRESLEKLLALPKEPWSTTAREDIDSCQPPVEELVGSSHGIPFLRWLLHRILPYPCFLWSETRLANRLRLPEARLAALLGMRTTLANRLRKAQYSGILGDFAGRRWWAAGVESALWDLTDGQPHDPSVLADLTGQPEPTGTPEIDSVLCVDADFRLMAQVVPSRLAVRIVPADWPPFAEQPWAQIELVQDAPHLRAIVNKADVSRLTENT
jgi:hypothetical protein